MGKKTKAEAVRVDAPVKTKSMKPASGKAKGKAKAK